MSNDFGRELGWDDVIESDSPDFITLPEGDYDFEVINFERARYTPKPGGKLPACNQAIVHLRFEAPEGVTIIKHNLYLHSTTEGLLCSFFTAIGQRRKGEKIPMNWNSVIGSRGRAKVGIRTFKKDNGDDGTANEVKRFYEPDESQANAKFTPGRF